jgi:uncharacterized protein
MCRLLNLCFVVLLSACSSAPLSINYYLLNSNPPPSPTDLADNAIKVELAEIKLADYLQQANLILQLKGNQIYYSRQDAWAENLQLAMAKSLLTDLNHSDSAIQYLNYRDPHQGKASYQLVLEVDHFQATDESLAIAQGSYWLLDSANNKPIIHQTFALETELEQDGYAHAVIQLRHLLTSLSQQISEDVTKAITEP